MKRLPRAFPTLPPPNLRGSFRVPASRTARVSHTARVRTRSPISCGGSARQPPPIGPIPSRLARILTHRAHVIGRNPLLADGAVAIDGKVEAEALVELRLLAVRVEAEETARGAHVLERGRLAPLDVCRAMTRAGGVGAAGGALQTARRTRARHTHASRAPAPAPSSGCKGAGSRGSRPARYISTRALRCRAAPRAARGRACTC